MGLDQTGTLDAAQTDRNSKLDLAPTGPCFNAVSIYFAGAPPLLAKELLSNALSQKLHLTCRLKESESRAWMLGITEAQALHHQTKLHAISLVGEVSGLLMDWAGSISAGLLPVAGQPVPGKVTNNYQHGITPEHCHCTTVDAASKDTEV